MRGTAWIPLFCLVPLSAPAIELDHLIETFEVLEAGDPAGSGRSEARGVALDPGGEVVVSGWVSGSAGPLDEDGWLARYDPVGGVIFESYLDQGPPGPERLHSLDRFFSLTLNGVGDPVVVGAISGDETARELYYTARFDGGGELVWENDFRDGSNSLHQEALGVAIDPTNDRVVTVGWSERSEAIAGQWVLRRLNGPGGTVQAGPVYYDHAPHGAAPDQAFAVAVHSDSSVVIAGAVGVDNGSDPSGSDADRDWLVRKLNPTLTEVLWEDSWGGAAGLEDAPRAIAIDPVGNLVVVGSTNTGTDNEDGSAFAWRVVKYVGATGAIQWAIEWAGPPGEDVHATAVRFDATGNLIISGTWSVGGVQTWRVVRLSYFDGSVLGERTWPVGPGDSILHDLAVLDGRLALVGTTETPSGSSAVVRVLDQDTDGDGVADRFEECPLDAAKLEPGICSCGRPDVDTDGDGVYDCHDVCPQNPEKTDSPGVCGCHRADTDSDGDGTPDCIDGCPLNPDKSEPGVCGCGMADEDLDGDGVLVCQDACPDTPAGAEVDAFGCSEDQRNLTPIDEEEPPASSASSGGCGCTTSPLSGSAWLALAGLGILLQRRRGPSAQGPDRRPEA